MDYRLYFFDNDGHIESVVVLVSESDDQAIALASAVADGRMMELWNMGRMVRTFPAGQVNPRQELRTDARRPMQGPRGRN